MMPIPRKLNSIGERAVVIRSCHSNWMLDMRTRRMRMDGQYDESVQTSMQFPEMFSYNYGDWKCVPRPRCDSRLCSPLRGVIGPDRCTPLVINFLYIREPHTGCTMIFFTRQQICCCNNSVRDELRLRNPNYKWLSSSMCYSWQSVNQLLRICAAYPSSLFLFQLASFLSLERSI